MLDYKKPSEVRDDYLTELKVLKPEVNKDQTDSDWYIRGSVVGGLLSGIYGDQKKLANDPFPQSARHDALERGLNTYFGAGFNSATKAQGFVSVNGSNGSSFLIGTELAYAANGNTYVATATVVASGGVAVVPVQSVAAGQAQNLLEGAALTISSPPSGFASSGVVVDGNISDGTDDESDSRASARLLDKIRKPLAGGKVSDYVKFALAADPSVVSANILRFPFGFGTVGVIITAGTTDIDAALNAGNPVILTPSGGLITAVQDYIDTQKPITDCVSVSGPTTVTLNLEVKVKFKSGNGATVLLGQTLTQTQLVQREVKRALYKTPPGGRILGGSGYVVASEIEETLDVGLSAEPYETGIYGAILVDRQVQNLDGSNVNKALLGNQIVIPGTITVTEV